MKKYIRFMAGICLMIFIFTGCGNYTTSKKTSKKKIDYDLVKMDKDEVYATVYQLMAEPKTYLGKTFRMKGQYYSSYDEASKKTYHFCIIKDATACCAQGLEFECKDKKVKYPKEESQVEVVGTFETYQIDGDNNKYCRLANAVIK